MMLKSFILSAFFSVLFVSLVFAQPANDDYANAINVSSIINSCSADGAYTNIGATMDKAQGSCNNGAGHNVWFKFQATATTISVKVDRGGSKGNIYRVNVAVWEANGTTEVTCNKYLSNEDDVEITSLGLVIGNWYYISIDNNYSNYRGTFTLCLSTTPSYDFYEGALDVSSLINSCSADAAYTTRGATMDKAQGSCNNGQGYNRWFKFQATATSMNVKVERGGTKGTIYRINVAIWEANGTTELACNRYVGTSDNVEAAALGLVIGNWYYISVDNHYGGYRGSFTLCLNSTPSYDFYEGALDVSSLINSCSADAAYTTIGATMDKAQGSCNNGEGYNRWFKFQATATTMNIKVDRGGTKGTIYRVNLAVWEANGTTEVACNRYVGTSDDVETAALGLVIGNWYYISVDNHYYNYRGSFTLCLNSTPSYDFYEGALDVSSLINSCSADAAYTTIGATMDKAQGSCNNGEGYNRWFKFQATATTMNVKVDRGGTKGTIYRINLAVWEANGTTEIACNRYVSTGDDVETTAFGLVIGNWYYISIDNHHYAYRGSFTLCLNTAPSYDFYEGAIDVSGLINSCSADAAYTTFGATMDKSQGSCNNGSGYNRWFKFQATATTMNVKLDRGGTKGTVNKANLAIWESNGTTEVACNRYVYTSDDVEIAGINLVIGNWYYISVDNNHVNYRGTFTLCLNTTPSYDFYEGAIDVSGLINSCSADAAYTTVGATMDKSQGSCNNGSGYNRWFKFQATAASMNVKLDRGGTKGTINKANLALWEANGTTEVICNKYVYTSDDVEMAGLNLVIGNWYYISVDNNHENYRGSFTLCLNSTPSYDFYEGALDISGLINSCSGDAVYTTNGATMDKAQGSCNNGSGYNRWFKFQATATTMNVKLDRGGSKGTVNKANLALWEANGTTEVVCNRYVYTGDDVELTGLGLVIGNWYYISVDNNHANYRGTFTLCLNTTPSYDYYEGALDVSSLINSCSADAAYTSIGATMDKAQGSCNNGSGYNRWFKFQATATAMSVKVELGGTKGTINRVNLAVWEANGSTEVTCNRYYYATEDVEISTLNLTIGDWYYISVDNYHENYRGSFTLCLNTTPSYDFYEGALELTNLHNACSGDAEYSTSGATMDKAQGSCNNGSGYNRWFKFTALETLVDITIKTGGSYGNVRRLNATLWESNGTSQLACEKYTSDYSDLNISYGSLTIGNTYYISVDNYLSNFRGSFTLCIDNIADVFYSRSSGNWNSMSTWSLVGHAGVEATNIPGLSDIVYIDGHNVSVSTDTKSAGTYVSVTNGNSSLVINNAELEVKGALKLENAGFNNSGTISLTNTSKLIIHNDFTIERNGGNVGLQVLATSTSIIEAKSNVYLNGLSGTGSNNQISLSNDAHLMVTHKFQIKQVTGVKSELILANNSKLTVGDDFNFTATGDDKVGISLQNSSSMIFHGVITRGAPAYGKINSTDNSTIQFNGYPSGSLFPKTASVGTSDLLTFQNVIINTNSSNDIITLENDVFIVKDLTVNSGKLMVPDGIAITVGNKIVNDGIIVVEDGGSLIQTGTGASENSGTGNYVIQRKGNATNDSYNIWSSPLQAASITSAFSGANPCDVWVFDPSNQAWTHDFVVGYSATCNGNAVTFGANDVIAGGDGVMNPGNGYFVPGSTSPTRSFDGQVNNGTITIPVVTTNLGNQTDWDEDDWNLIGNPYPSAISASLFWNENAVNNSRIMDAMYFWDSGDTLNGYNQFSDYASWNLTGGVNSGNSSTIPNGNIASGQGFWVYAITDASVEFNNSMRLDGNSQYFKNETDIEQHNYWFSFKSPAQHQNNILVGYGPFSTDSIDSGYDAHKLIGNAHIKFASYIGNEEFVIQSFGALDYEATKIISLVVQSDESGIHHFSEYNKQNTTENVTVYFRDKLLNELHDFKLGELKIYLEANVEYTDRFELIFYKQSKPTSILEEEEEEEHTYTFIQNETHLTITNENGIQGDIKVLDALGKVVWMKQNRHESTSQSIAWSGFASGVYHILITRDNETILVKKVVKL